MCRLFPLYKHKYWPAIRSNRDKSKSRIEIFVIQTAIRLSPNLSICLLQIYHSYWNVTLCRRFTDNCRSISHVCKRVLSDEWSSKDIPINRAVASINSTSFVPCSFFLFIFLFATFFSRRSHRQKEMWLKPKERSRLESAWTTIEFNKSPTSSIYLRNDVLDSLLLVCLLHNTIEVSDSQFVYRDV